MVADWMGAGRAITGKWDVAGWYADNWRKIHLRPETRRAGQCARQGSVVMTPVPVPVVNEYEGVQSDVEEDRPPVACSAPGRGGVGQAPQQSPGRLLPVRCEGIGRARSSGLGRERSRTRVARLATGRGGFVPAAIAGVRSRAKAGRSETEGADR